MYRVFFSSRKKAPDHVWLHSGRYSRELDYLIIKKTDRKLLFSIM